MLVMLAGAWSGWRGLGVRPASAQPWLMSLIYACWCRSDTSESGQRAPSRSQLPAPSRRDRRAVSITSLAVPNHHAGLGWLAWDVAVSAPPRQHVVTSLGGNQQRERAGDQRAADDQRILD